MNDPERSYYIESYNAVRIPKETDAFLLLSWIARCKLTKRSSQLAHYSLQLRVSIPMVLSLLHRLISKEGPPHDALEISDSLRR